MNSIVYQLEIFFFSKEEEKNQFKMLDFFIKKIEVCFLHIKLIKILIMNDLNQY